MVHQEREGMEPPHHLLLTKTPVCRGVRGAFTSGLRLSCTLASVSVETQLVVRAYTFHCAPCGGARQWPSYLLTAWRL
eukprot:11322930-Karenia_brevis.AAC.1